MILELKSNDKCMNFNFYTDDYKFVDLNSFIYNQSQIATLHGWLARTKCDGIVVTLLDDHLSQIMPQLSLIQLVKEFGLYSIDDLQLYNIEDKRYITTLPYEILVLYMWYIVGYKYYEKDKRIYDIKSGTEIQLYSVLWDNIRNPNDCYILKSLMVGRTLQEYFETKYNRTITAKSVLIYSSCECDI